MPFCDGYSEITDIFSSLSIDASVITHVEKMKVFALRLKPNQDLRQSFKNFANEENIKAGFILTAIGSLKQATIRFANQSISKVLNDKFEIIALNGTLATTGVHLHTADSEFMRYSKSNV